MKAKVSDEAKESRSYKVVKANDMIQKARYDLSMSEIKLMSFIFAKVKITDKEGQDYVFSLKEFCEVCGISNESTRNHQHIRNAIDGLKQKHFWIVNERGNEETVDWIRKAEIDKKSGRISVKLDEAIFKYVMGLCEGNYTWYQLFFILPMKSAYSIRVYEMLKSYEGYCKETKKPWVVEVDNLKAQLMAEHYKEFNRFRQRVLDIAVKEINDFTDIHVTWEPVKDGNRVVRLRFMVKENKNLAKAYFAGFDALDGKKKSKPKAKQIPGQMNLEFADKE